MVKTPPNPSERTRNEVMRGTLDIEKDEFVTSIGETKEELKDINGVGRQLASDLRGAGFYSIGGVARASRQELAEVDGVGPAKADDLIDAATVAISADFQEITDVDGVGETNAMKLRAAGIRDPYELRGKSQSTLSAIDGIGPKRAARIRADVEFEAPAGATETGYEPETETGTSIFTEGRGVDLSEFGNVLNQDPDAGEVKPTAANTFAKGPDRQEAIGEHSERTPESRRADESFNAPLMLDEDTWERNKNEYDYPGVDTIPRSRKLERSRDEASKAKEKGFLRGVESETQATEKDRARGQFDSIRNKIAIDTDFRRSENTFAHEVGHAVDAGTDRPSGQPSMGSETAGIFDDPEVLEQAKEVSRQRRGKELDSEYLESKSEVFADLFAEATINPRRAKKEAPDAIRAMNEEIGQEFGFF